MNMIRLIGLLAVLLPGLAWGATTSTPPFPPGSAGRGLLNVSPRYYSTMDGFGAFGDAQQAWALLAITSGTNTLNVGGTAATTVTNVTINYGANTLTTSGSLFSAGTQLNGVPISITGAGAGGGTLNTRIVFAFGSTGASLAGPASNINGLSASSQTVTIGSYFSAATDAGKKIVVPGAGSAGADLATTYTVSDSNNVVLGANASTTLSSGNLNNWNLITWAHDDSTAINNLIAAALARGDRFVYVPNKHYVPSLNASAVNLIFYGEGQFIGSPYPTVRVIPSDAPQAAVPTNTVNPVSQLTALKATATPILITSGDSLWQERNDPATTEQILPFFQHYFANRNGTKTFTFYDRAIGGQTYSTFDSIANTFPTWYSNHSQQWLGSSVATGYIFALAPDVLVEGFQNNDLPTFSISSFLDAQAKIVSWAKVPDRIIATHWNKSPLNSGAGAPLGDSNAMFLRTYAEANNLALLDFNRQGDRTTYGYDPAAMALTATPCFNDYTNKRFSLPFTAPTGCTTTGYEAAFTDVTGQSGSAFWAHYGNEIQFQISSIAGNLYRIGYDNTADTTGKIGSGNLYYECDISSAYPGAGCAHGTVPTILANFSISASSNSLTSSASVFVSSDDAHWLTIPGANTAGGFLVCYMHYVSATNVTLFNEVGLTTPCNAVTALSSSNQVVLRGNPKNQTSIAMAADTSGSELFGFSAVGDMVTAWWQDPGTQTFFVGPVVRFGNTFTPKITANANFPLGPARFGDTLPVFFIEQPKLNWPSLTDTDVNGPDSNSPISNPSYVGILGGAGDNHPTSYAWTDIIKRVIEAQNFSATQ